MQLGTVNIRTPYPELGGDPTHYDPDFRNKVARAISDGVPKSDVPAVLLSNRALLNHAKFLSMWRNNANTPEAVYRKYPEHGLVHTWYTCDGGTQTKHYLESLLLTDQPIEVIAADLGISTDLIRLYEQLYMHCRDAKDYSMHLPARTRMAFALGPILEAPARPPTEMQWRIIAVQQGYSGLVYRWGWEYEAHGVHKPLSTVERNRQIIIMQLDTRLRSNALTTEDFVMLAQLNSDMERVQLEKALRGDDRNASDEAIIKILQMLTPKVLQRVATPEQLAEAEAVNRKNLLAERNITEHGAAVEQPQDADRTQSTFSRFVKTKFKSVRPQGGEL